MSLRLAWHVWRPRCALLGMTCGDRDSLLGANARLCVLPRRVCVAPTHPQRAPRGVPEGSLIWGHSSWHSMQEMWDTACSSSCEVLPAGLPAAQGCFGSTSGWLPSRPAVHGSICALPCNVWPMLTGLSMGQQSHGTQYYPAPYQLVQCSIPLKQIMPNLAEAAATKCHRPPPSPSTCLSAVTAGKGRGSCCHETVLCLAPAQPCLAGIQSSSKQPVVPAAAGWLP